MLELIRENCTAVAILEISLHDFWSNDANGSRTIKQAVLESLDARFKAIPSLKEVIVYDYDDLSKDLVKKMHDYGWTVKLAKHRDWEADWEDDPDIDVEDYIATFEEEEECEDSDLDYD